MTTKTKAFVAKAKTMLGMIPNDIAEVEKMLAEVNKEMAEYTWQTAEATQKGDDKWLNSIKYQMLLRRNMLPVLRRKLKWLRKNDEKSGTQ